MIRRLFVPEVTQTSATDCGPAALKALFAGHGIYLSYGRLREACHTDVDGTSIDTLETLGNALGLGLEQRMLSTDLVLVEGVAELPAIAVVRLPDGALHFVVIWRTFGPYVQVMDPAAGRLWIRRRRLLDSLHRHEQDVPSSAWAAWIASPAFKAGIDHRLRRLGIVPQSWPDAAHLDASIRLARALVDNGLLKRGRQAAEFLELCARNADQIPDEYWAVRQDPDDAARVRIRGAVLVVATGERTSPDDSSAASVRAIQSEPPPAVWAPVWSAIRESGGVAVLVAAVICAAGGVVIEALLFRGLLDLTDRLPRSADRLAWLALVIGFCGMLLALEWSAVAGLLRIGRQLELRFRALLLRKVPRLEDRYFQSRLISDMASRAHALQLMRELPEVAALAGSLACTLLFTVAAIAWLFPGAALPAIVAGAAAVGVPWLFRRGLLERDLRVRETSAGLSRFYLDGLLGACTIQAHSADGALMGAQSKQLEQWADAGLRRQTLMVTADAVQSALCIGSVVWLILGQAAAGWTSSLLLLTFWAVSIPAIGAELATVLWTVPLMRNTILRFLEPLGSPEQDGATPAPRSSDGGVAVHMDGVRVLAGGHVLLDDISLRITPGEHVAVVGPSGSGKSSLAGLLLGWHTPAQGGLLIDDRPLDAAELSRMRQCTAWIDPQVHLFRATVYSNLTFGNLDAPPGATADAIDDSGLLDVLPRLPDGLQTLIGDGGGSVSAGEGQRIRIGRALLRAGVRLAILDEPGRGLDRDRRRSVLADARRHFREATVLAITHDIADTLEFDRVLVMEGGRIVENGVPRHIVSDERTRYAALLREERLVQSDVWSHPQWRRLRMASGRLTQPAEQPDWTLV